MRWKGPFFATTLGNAFFGSLFRAHKSEGRGEKKKTGSQIFANWHEKRCALVHPRRTPRHGLHPTCPADDVLQANRPKSGCVGVCLGIGVSGWR